MTFFTEVKRTASGHLGNALQLNYLQKGEILNMLMTLSKILLAK